MNNFNTTLFFFFGFISLSLFHVSIASIISTGDFNKDFFVIWSPNHVNTSDDGKTRTLKLDQESGNLNLCFS
jgi:xyloglucan:xyloglucosyl transferase